MCILVPYLRKELHTVFESLDSRCKQQPISIKHGVPQTKGIPQMHDLLGLLNENRHTSIDEKTLKTLLELEYGAGFQLQLEEKSLTATFPSRNNISIFDVLEETTFNTIKTFLQHKQCCIHPKTCSLNELQQMIVTKLGGIKLIPEVIKTSTQSLSGMRRSRHNFFTPPSGEEGSLYKAYLANDPITMEAAAQQQKKSIAVCEWKLDGKDSKHYTANNSHVYFPKADSGAIVDVLLEGDQRLELRPKAALYHKG